MSTSPEAPAPSTMERAFWCGFYGSGIVGSLLVYGLLQERIMTQPYDGQLFKVSAFLVLCNRVVNCMFATTMIAVRREEIGPQAPIWKYLVISLSNVAATTCQYEALKYVSFPVQMLGKSFKMMPVMVWGIIISRKRYSGMDWLVAAAVTGGVTEFLMTGSISSPNDPGNSWHGLLLLVCFLACDGLTSTSQEKLFKELKTTKYNQMFYVNMCSVVVSLVSLFIANKFFSSLAFATSHWLFAWDAMILSASAAAGQYFIYSQVKEYGALVFAATMNVRQIISIVVSYITYGHIINVMQAVGLVFVFGALFYKSYLGLAKSGKKEERKPLLNGESAGSEQGATKPKADV